MPNPSIERTCPGKPNQASHLNVKEQIITGYFNNVSPVLRAGLRLLEDLEQAQASKLQELRALIQEGEASGPDVDAEEVFDRLENKYKSAVIALDAQQSGSLQSPLALTPTLSRKERK